MSKLAWQPWHQVVPIRDDLKSGDLSLEMFAADLYEVAMQPGRRPIYEDPAEFFSLTYATFNQRQLAKDVVHRLAGRSEKAVRQLALTYGGGKTHTLITLFHLVNDPENLPDLPAVQEFKQDIGIPLPQARVVTLPFDKIDAEKAVEVRGPDKTIRPLKHPWSWLAYQIAGDEGLKCLHPDDQAAERESAPSETLLVKLLSMPQQQGLSVLILIDEVLMYVREKVGLDANWRGKLVNFFQYLTQAAVKVNRCAIVASLLATDPNKSDTLGKELTQELYSIFRREEDEKIEPVSKEDVAEVLCRRFFKPEAIRDRQAFRPHVVAALKGINDLDDETKREGKSAEDKFLKNFPFHPDLTDILYTKWTQLEGFQRTRGVLRTFAYGLREAAHWDTAPLVGPNILLSAPDKAGLSIAMTELAGVATAEEYEGKTQQWKAILEGELEKARSIQAQTVGLNGREIEQAVVATFLHSQPIGQKALTRELMLLLGHTRPDRIQLEKALINWTEVSWFLDEDFLQEAGLETGGQKTLPKSWRLGSKPNLKQMHHDACRDRISDDYVEQKLLEELKSLKSLTAGTTGSGIKVHSLPNSPQDVGDEGDFHYVLLGPKAASRSGSPSAEARRFVDEKAGVDSPRVYRNAVILAAPDRDGLDVVRIRIREYLGWEEVKYQLKDQELDPSRQQRLDKYVTDSKGKIPDSIRQAYCIVITASDKNEVQAFKLTISGDKNLFELIKTDDRARIQETAVTAEALIPGGPYDLWREGEPSRRVKDLVGAFAQYPRLPKMLNNKAILDTLVDGCESGIFVLQYTRADRSVKTFWKERPDDVALKDATLEAVLPESADITELSSSLLLPGQLPALWRRETLLIRDLYDYFSGQHIVQIQKEGYEEPLLIPHAEPAILDVLVVDLVKDGKLWFTSGQTSLWKEEIPAGILTEEAELHTPPRLIPIQEILPQNLPEAWGEEQTTARAIADELSQRDGNRLPWATVRDVINGAFNAGILQRTTDSAAWPCDLAGADAVKLQLPQAPQLPIVPLSSSPRSHETFGLVISPNKLSTEADLQTNEIQELVDQISDIKSAAVGLDLKFHLRIELSGASRPSEETITKINELLKEVSDKLELK
jgi:hypothetical protein